MKFLDKVAEDIKKQFDRNQIPTLARSLRESINISSSKKPISVRQLVREFELPDSTLLKAKVIITREQAVQFLLELPSGRSESELLRKILTQKFYHTKLKRNIANIKNGFAYTYSELLFLCGFVHALDFPSVLEPYLDR